MYEGKKVLLIAPKFYSMQDEIKKGLEYNGAIVDYYEDKVFKHDYKRADCYGIRKTFYSFLESLRNRATAYWKKEIKSFGIYDVLIWIDGFSFSKTVIDKVTSDNPGIKKILYLYDDTNFYNFEDSFSFFDSLFSFDEKDYEKFNDKYNMNYLPLYWVKDNVEVEKKYDISCIGYCLEERLDAFNKLKNLGLFNNLSVYIKLFLAPLGRFGYVKQLIKYPFFKKDRKKIRLYMGKEKSDFIVRSPIPKNITLDVIRSSKCVVDIVKKTQVGFTNRAMQTIGNRIKILSNNEFLLDAPFYDDSLIFVFNNERINLEEIKLFLDKPVNSINNDFLNGLEINNWVLRLNN